MKRTKSVHDFDFYIDVKELKNERKAREYLEDEEVEKLMKSFDKGLYKEHRDSMIIMLLMDIEMRLGECLKIKLQDIDMTERTICLPAENTKGRQTRFVFFSVTTARSLQRWIRFKDRYSCGAYLFSGKTGMPFEVHSFETNFKRYLARAGIEKEYTPHALRNNFAKRCLMNGMDIYTLSRILGHSSVTVTEKAYLNRIFDLINQEFFQCTLSRPTITIQSTPKAYGHFSLRDDTWISKKGATHEINIGAGTLARPIEEVCATLLHEMVHYHNYVLGIQDCSRGGTYHNRRFRDSAEEHGLIANHHDKYGWTITSPSDRLLQFCLDNDLSDILINRNEYSGWIFSAGQSSPILIGQLLFHSSVATIQRYIGI